MRRTKRILALVLAFAAMLSLGAGAAAGPEDAPENYEYDYYGDPLGLFAHEDGRTYASRAIAELYAAYGRDTETYFNALGRTGIVTFLVEPGKPNRLRAGADYPDGKGVTEYILEHPVGLLYADVPQEAWYYEAVRGVTAGALVFGDGGGTFRPMDPVTVAELATVLCRIYGIHYENISGEPDRRVIDALFLAKLDFGSCVYERKNESVTRGEAIEALLVAQKAAGREPARALTWADVQDAEACRVCPTGHAWSPTAMLDALNYGVITGVNANHRVNAASPVTRAELCQMLTNIGVTQANSVASYKAYEAYLPYAAEH